MMHGNIANMLFLFKKRFGFLLSFVVLALVGLVNIWHSHLLPFTDFPNHLLEAYILQGHLPSDYGMNMFWYSPACLHAIFCALFPNIEVGNKVFYSLYILLLPLIMILLIRASHGEKWFGLLSFCFLYSYSVTWGFSSFTMGIALSLLTIYSYIGMLSAPSLLRFILLSCLLILTFYAHAILFIFVSIVIGFCTLFLLDLPMKHRLLGVLSVFPSIIIFTFWLLNSDSWHSQQSTLAFLVRYYENDYIYSLPSRVFRLLTADNTALANGYLGKAIALIWSIPLLLLLPSVLKNIFLNGYNYICISPRPPKCFPTKTDHPLEPNSSTANARAVALVFFFVVAGCFTLLPDQIPGQWILFERFSVIIFLSLIWIGSFTLTSQNRIVMLRRPLQSLFVLMVILSTVLWTDYFWHFRNDSSDFEHVLRDTPELQGKSLAAIIGDHTYRGRPVFFHFQNYHTLWNGGLVPTRAAEYRFRLITRKKDAEIPNYTVWMNKRPDIRNLIRKYEGMNFLLVRGSNVITIVEECGEYNMRSRKNGWFLFRRIGDKKAIGG